VGEPRHDCSVEEATSRGHDCCSSPRCRGHEPPNRFANVREFVPRLPDDGLDDAEQDRSERPDGRIDHVPDHVEAILDDRHPRRFGESFEFRDVPKGRTGRRQFHTDDVAGRREHDGGGNDEPMADCEPRRYRRERDETTVPPSDSENRVLRRSDSVASARATRSNTAA